MQELARQQWRQPCPSRLRTSRRSRPTLSEPLSAPPLGRKFLALCESPSCLLPSGVRSGPSHAGSSGSRASEAGDVWARFPLCRCTTLVYRSKGKPHKIQYVINLSVTYSVVADGVSAFRPSIDVHSCPWACSRSKRLLTFASAGVLPCALTFIPIADRFVGRFMGSESGLKWHGRLESCQRSYFRNYLPGRILTAAGFIYKSRRAGHGLGFTASCWRAGPEKWAWDLCTPCPCRRRAAKRESAAKSGLRAPTPSKRVTRSGLRHGLPRQRQ